MLKPDSLRRKLTSAFPELERNPNRLRLWIEEGHIRSHAGIVEVGDNLNFSLEYTLTVVIEEWTQETVLIWITLIDWLRIHQPELLQPANSKTALPFEADLISNKEADISFDLTLTEVVRTTKREDGGFNMQFVSEPDPLMPDAVPMIPDGEPLKVISLRDDQLVP